MRPLVTARIAKPARAFTTRRGARRLPLATIALAMGALLLAWAPAVTTTAHNTTSRSVTVQAQAPLNGPVSLPAAVPHSQQADQPQGTTQLTQPENAPEHRVGAVKVAPAPSVPTTSSGTTTAAASTAGAYGCSAALAYLRANSAPGFVFECPGYSDGRQAMTCVNHAPECPGMRLITITVPCAAAYMNEAHNSWVVAGLRSGAIDPYGYCH